MEVSIPMRRDTDDQLLKRLDDLERRIKSQEFIKTTGTTNTVNYWVFDYNPRQELMVRERIHYIERKNTEALDGFKLYVIDLYELLVEHFEENDYLEQCERFEKKHDLEYLVAAVKNSLQITGNQNVLMQKITAIVPAEEMNIVFLTGMGKCFPLLQGPEIFNQVLYNMPEEYNRTPVILFYPGTYTEQELIIFNELIEDNFYRAYRIVR